MLFNRLAGDVRHVLPTKIDENVKKKEEKYTVRCCINFFVVLCIIFAHLAGCLVVPLVLYCGC